MALRRWWDTLMDIGPKYGYYPKPEKTVLVVKEQYLAEANRLFENSRVQLTTEGHRHLGAVIGIDAFRDQYIREKIQKWVEGVEKLSLFAENEPQAAMTAFGKGISNLGHPEPCLNI